MLLYIYRFSACLVLSIAEPNVVLRCTQARTSSLAVERVTFEGLLSYVHQAAQAMAHLERANIVHGHLAAYACFSSLDIGSV